MSLSMSLEAEGLEGMKALVKEFKRLGTKVKSVRLNSIERQPYEFQGPGPQPTNRYLLETAFPHQERDFISRDSDQDKQIADAFEAVAQAEIDKFKAKVAKLTDGEIQRAIDQAASKAWIAAMKAYMDVVRDNINNARIVNKKLTKHWEEIKQKHFARTYPIGIASEQLIENLDSKGATAVRNIRLSKK